MNHNEILIFSSILSEKLIILRVGYNGRGLENKSGKFVENDIQELINKVIYFQDNLVSYSTGRGWGNYELDFLSNEKHYSYEELRIVLLSEPLLKNKLPDFILQKRNLNHYWDFIKNKFSSYAERKTFLWGIFGEIITYLESISASVGITDCDERIKIIDSEYINHEWGKAKKRIIDDPSGAITIAKTMLEGLMKNLLLELGEELSGNEDFPKLYKLLSKKLKLSPDAYTEPFFKETLSGMFSIIKGLSTIRNNYGDSHHTIYKPSSRHAELVVTLSGTLSIFLLQTYQENIKK